MHTTIILKMPVVRTIFEIHNPRFDPAKNLSPYDCSFDVINQLKMEAKVWMVIGREDDLSRITTKYLLSRDQVVIHLQDFRNLESVSDSDTSLHKLIINNVRHTDLEYTFKRIYQLSSRLPSDGSGQIIFLSSDSHCIQHLEKDDAFLALRKQMENKAIAVHCFEPG